MTKRIRTKHRWIALLGLVVVTACNSPIEGEDTARGSYTLTAVDGAPPPGVVSQSASETVELTGGSLTLGGNGECSMTRMLRTTTNSGSTNRTQKDECGWTRRGTSIFLTMDIGAIPGTWDEVAFTAVFILGGHTLTFQR